MKNLFIITLLLGLSYSGFAQQFALYNTRTLFDSFENPSQKAFMADTSGSYALNLLPVFELNAATNGPALPALKKLLFEQAFNANELAYNGKQHNKFFVSSNTYLAMFRIFKDVNYSREMGFAWQIKSNSYADITNESLTLFKDLKSFPTGEYSNNPLGNKGSSQTYHQFSFTYREDYSTRLGLGVKISYLSGIAYNKLNIKYSGLSVNQTTREINFDLRGEFKSNFLYSTQNENGKLVAQDGLANKLIWPGFKNPGLAITASANYKFKNGWYVLGNVKDIGFIRWSKDSYNFDLNKSIPITNNSTSQLTKEIAKLIYEGYKQKSILSFIDGKAEVLISKNMGTYQPNVLLSQNLSNRGTDAILINNFNIEKSTLSLTTGYNSNKFFMVGGQYLYKNPNFEFFIGSDNLLKTTSLIQGMIKQDSQIGSGYMGTSFYLGLSIKYGSTLEHQQNATRIPGFGKENQQGFFSRFLSVFKKKKK